MAKHEKRNFRARALRLASACTWVAVLLAGCPARDDSAHVAGGAGGTVYSGDEGGTGGTSSSDAAGVGGSAPAAGTHADADMPTAGMTAQGGSESAAGNGAAVAGAGAGAGASGSGGTKESAAGSGGQPGLQYDGSISLFRAVQP